MKAKVICVMFLELFRITMCDNLLTIPLLRQRTPQQLVVIDKIAKTSRVKRAVINDMDNAYNLKGIPGSGYQVQVAIGTPPQMFNVLVDTGSSNFAVAATAQPEINTTYYHANMSSTSAYIGTEVYVPYTLGEWTGYLMTDVVSFPSLPGAGNFTANIAGIEESENFFLNGSLWQGILGLGYPELARPDSNVSPLLDSWFAGTDLPHVFSLQLCGVHSSRNENDTSLYTGGVMTLGGVDESLYTGTIQYSPIYKQWYYEIILTDIKVNGQSLDLPCKEYNFDKTIVDSGTTNLRLPAKVYDHLVREIQHATVMHEDGWRIEPPAEFWAGEEMMCWDEGSVPWDGFPAVALSLEASRGRVFDLQISAKQYLMRIENEEQPLDACYRFAVSVSESGTVIGSVVMEAFYVVFDREQNKVGFAETTCETDEPTGLGASVSAIYKVKYNTTECAYLKSESDQKTLAIAMYVMLAVIMLCMLPLVVFFIHWQYHKHCRGDSKCFPRAGHNDQDNLLEAPGTANSLDKGPLSVR